MLFASTSLAQDNGSSGCTIIFAAHGGAYQVFTEQVKQLAPHLRRQQVRLIDLNHWPQQWPYLPVSGRDKARLRRFHQITGFGKRAKTQAVLLDADGVAIKRYANTLNLVDMLLDCPSR